VADVTEQYLDQVGSTIQPQVLDKTMALSAAVARGVWQIITDLKVKLVAVWSQTGMTARIFSKYRFPVPIVAFSSDPRTLRQMAIHYGVIPREMPQTPSDVAGLVAQVDQLVMQKNLAKPADRIVIVAGSALGAPGTMNGIIIHSVGESPITAVSNPFPS
jgi:pyruvate kinase